MLKRKPSASALSALVALTTLVTTAVSPLPANGQSRTHETATTVLQFPSWQENEPGYDTFYNSMVTQFEAAHPGVSIHFYEIDYVDYIPKITTLIAAGDAPDILVLPLTNYASFAANGDLTPLDSYLHGTPILSAGWAPLQDSLKVNGHYYNVLAQGFSWLMFANKAILADHHLPLPATIPQLIADAKAVTGNGTYGAEFATAEDPDNTSLALALLAGDGVPVVKGSSWSLTTPAVAGAFNQLRQLAQYASPGLLSEQAETLFMQGKSAFLLDGSYELPAIAATGTPTVKKNAVMLEFPTHFQNNAVSSTFAIPSSIPATDKKLAWDFIQQTTTLPAEKLFVKDVDAPAPLLAADSAVPMPYASVQIAGAKGVNPIPSIPKLLTNFGVITTDMDTAVSKMFSSNASTTSILQGLQSQLPSLK